MLKYTTFNDVSNQQGATTVSFIDLFNSALHVSGDKFAHPQEHFLTVYTAFFTMHRLCCWLRRFHLNRCTGRQQYRRIVPKAVYTVKKCSWGWANWSPETCRADLKRLINEKVFASCWLLTPLHYWCKVIQKSALKCTATFYDQIFHKILAFLKTMTIKHGRDHLNTYHFIRRAY